VYIMYVQGTADPRGGVHNRVRNTLVVIGESFVKRGSLLWPCAFLCGCYRQCVIGERVSRSVL